MNNFLELAQTLQMALKALQMYTPAHPRAVATVEALATSLGGWLQEQPQLHISTSAGKVFANGSPVEGLSLHLQALAKQLGERQISGLVFQRGVDASEILAVLQTLILKPSKIEEQGGIARVMESLNLHRVSLSQTQYREVREGDGDGADAAPLSLQGQAIPASAMSASAIETLEAEQLGTILRQWRVHLLAASEQLGSPTNEAQSAERILGRIPQVDLSGLGAFARESGWTDGTPSESQMASLRQALQSLPAETRLGVLKGLDSAPSTPAGLRQGLERLAPDIFGEASTELLAQGTAWRSLRENLFEILRQLPQQQSSMLEELERHARRQSMDIRGIQDLFHHLEWENATLDTQLRMTLEQGRLWALSTAERLEFLRKLLDQNRLEPFLKLLEEVTTNLTAEDPPTRESAAQTLGGVTQWVADPGLPPEAESLVQPALTAHFGWEPILQIHRPTEAAIQVLLGHALHQGDPTHAQGIIQELSGLCAFLEDEQPWRREALERLEGSLASPDLLAQTLEGLHGAAPEALLNVFLPYFEFLGTSAARFIVQALGEEPDRKRRGRLLELIRHLGASALSALEEGLHSERWYLVRNTLNLLSEMGDASLLEDVSRCLNHEDGRVRRAAVRAVWKLGGPPSGARLLNVFPTADPETQLEILFGLSQIQSAAAVPVLGEFGKNPQTPERLRLKAIETLGHIGNAAAIPFLIDITRRRGRIFTSAEPLDVRLAAANALSALGSPQALEALRLLAQDEPKGREKEALLAVLNAPRRA